MHFLHPSPISLIQRDSFLSNEVEVLQTDVMRFFAILCLCLMAIFALVKALPMAPPAGLPTLVEPGDLQSDAAALQSNTAELKEKLAQLRTQVQAAAVEAEKSAASAAAAEKKEQEARNRLNQARRDFEGVSRSLAENRSALKVREMKLAEILKDLNDKQRIRNGLQSQIENETQHLADIRTSLEQAREQLKRRLPAKPPSAKMQPAETQMPPPGRSGFTLRFASDEVLQQLIRRGRVSFYAIAGKKAWQLKPQNERPVYAPVEFPRQFYEMQTATVPHEYSGAFQGQVAAFGRTAVTWGVTLPSQTTADIHRIIENRTGGDLVITAGGEVELK
jgi:hypothetical protein